MKIAVIGDLHLGCTDFSEKRASDFSNKFIEALRKIFERDVECIILLGDVFDSSAYRRSVDRFAYYLHEIATGLIEAKKREIPILCIMGNHEFGRGRAGGELRILKDLGFIHLLNDECVEIKGQNFYGISWKNDKVQFNEILTKVRGKEKNSILLIHQFVCGSAFIPRQICEVDKTSLVEWKKVFVGHHHIHESFDNICIPGSLEIHNVHELSKNHKKGFLIYDTEKNLDEFIEILPSRKIKYLEFLVDKLNPQIVDTKLKQLISDNSEKDALIIVKLKGKLISGSSSEINFREYRILGIQNGCISVSFINNIDDPVRSAPEIRETIKVEDYLIKSFQENPEKALLYFENFNEAGDKFIPQIRKRIIEGIK